MTNTNTKSEESKPEESKFKFDVERKILSGIIKENGLIFIAKEKLQRADFKDSKNQIIFDAMVTISSLEMDIDVLTITQHLKDTGKLEEIGGLAFITNLSIERYTEFCFLDLIEILKGQKSLELMSLEDEIADIKFMVNQYVAAMNKNTVEVAAWIEKFVFRLESIEKKLSMKHDQSWIV